MTVVFRRPVLSVAIAAVVAAMIGLLGLVMCPGSAYASIQFDTAKSPQTIFLYPGADGMQTISLVASKDDDGSQSTPESCKSSNPKVLSVDGAYSGAVDLTVKKAGKATITVGYEGETYTIKFIVKKYVSPVKTLKIGKKNYASKLKKWDYTLASTSKLKGKLNVVPAKNWKLKSAKLGYYTKGMSYKTKSVKNGAKINGVYLTLTFKNKKTKVVETLTIDADTDMD